MKGGLHEIVQYEGDPMISKFPLDHNTITYQHAISFLEYCQRYLGDYLPKTTIIRDGSSYIVEQEKIEGEILKDIPLDQISKETIRQLQDLLEKFGTMVISNNTWVDLVGFQSETSDKNVKKRKRFKNKSIARLFFYAHIRQHWKTYSDLFKSSNIIVTPNGEIKLVDNVSGMEQEEGLDVLDKIHYFFLKLYRRFLVTGYKEQVRNLI